MLLINFSHFHRFIAFSSRFSSPQIIIVKSMDEFSSPYSDILTATAGPWLEASCLHPVAAQLLYSGPLTEVGKIITI